jgi:hypothetical protein
MSNLGDKLNLIFNIASAYKVDIDSDGKHKKLVIKYKREIMGYTIQNAIQIYYSTVIDLDVAEISEFMRNAIHAIHHNVDREYKKVVEALDFY